MAEESRPIATQSPEGVGPKELPAPVSGALADGAASEAPTAGADGVASPPVVGDTGLESALNLVLENPKLFGIVVTGIVSLILGIVFLWLFRDPIAAFIRERHLKFKVGGAEMDAAPPPPPTEDEPVSTAGAEAAAPQPLAEDASEIPSTVEVGRNNNVDGEEDSLVAALWKLHHDDVNSADEIFDKLHHQEQDGPDKIRNEAMYRSWRFMLAEPRSSDLDRLEQLAAEPVTRSFVLANLGDCLSHAERPDDAGARFEQAVETARDREDLVSATLRLARNHLTAERHDDARDLLRDLVAHEEEGERRKSIWIQLAEVEEKSGNGERAAMLREAAVQEDPTDVWSLFDTAYLQSQKDLPLLSALNYATVLKFNQEHANAANNLGVACRKLGLPARAVANFRRAEQLGETLPTANIADALLDGGLVDEAIEILRAAQESEDPHENVASTMARAQRMRDAEKTKWDAAMEAAERQKRFVRSYVEHCYTGEGIVGDVPGTWSIDGSGEAVFQAPQKDESTGSFATGGGLAALGLQLGWRGQEATWDKRLKLRIGFTSARVADATVRLWQFTGGLGFGTSGGNWGAEMTGKAYLTADEQEIHVMLDSDKKAPRYYTFRRVG